MHGYSLIFQFQGQPTLFFYRTQPHRHFNRFFESLSPLIAQGCFRTDKREVQPRRRRKERSQKRLYMYCVLRYNTDVDLFLIPYESAGYKLDQIRGGRYSGQNYYRIHYENGGFVVPAVIILFRNFSK